MGRNQLTIAAPVEICGKGLHLGLMAHMRFLPAPVATGLRFRLTKGKPVDIPVDISCIHPKLLRTALSSNGAAVETVEHALAAAYGLGISNMIIELDEIEPPACDGSALEFCRSILSVGLKDQGVEKDTLVIREPFSLQAEEGVSIAVFPNGKGLSVSFSLAGEGLPTQTVHYHHTRENFLRFVAPARTFCREFEVEKLRGLPEVGEGANTENTLVVKMGDIDKTQKFENELAYHKILDLLGDLALLGREIQGHVVCHHSGHPSNHKFVRQLRKLNGEKTMGINQIREILPHSYPFLLVDKVLGYEERQWVIGLKNVTINEPFFQGHYPKEPIMPGVLILEALAQTGAIMIYKDIAPSQLVVFAGADKVKFRSRVVPGDQMFLEVRAKSIRSRVGVVRGVATVRGEIACEADIKFMIV